MNYNIILHVIFKRKFVGFGVCLLNLLSCIDEVFGMATEPIRRAATAVTKGRQVGFQGFGLGSVKSGLELFVLFDENSSSEVLIVSRKYWCYWILETVVEATSARMGTDFRWL
jgi:hypothetical protein